MSRVSEKRVERWKIAIFKDKNKIFSKLATDINSQIKKAK